MHTLHNKKGHWTFGDSRKAGASIPPSELIQILGWSPMEINTMVAQAGARLGDHYHEVQEAFFLVSGEITFILEGESSALTTIIMSPGDLLHLGARVNHVAFIGNEGAVFNSFLPCPFPDSGTVRQTVNV